MRAGERRARALVAEELAQAPVEPAVVALAEAARARGPGALAVVYYGSALREGWSPDKLVDLYVVVEAYRPYLGGVAPAFAARLMPPNVYYLEAEFEGGTARAKVAVVALRQLRARARGLDPYFWARFSQPCAFAWVGQNARAADIAAAFATCARTLLRAARPLTLGDDPLDLWRRGFRESYRTEFRAERAGRGDDIVAAAPERYRALAAAFDEPPMRSQGSARRLWALRRLVGRASHVARLAKAAFTFTGGLDYLLWKIERHSGVRVEVRPWQRRHPLIAAPGLAFKLWRAGGFR